MAVLKCKMCGGSIVLIENKSLSQCEYCGVIQTVPSTNDEKILRLFDRAHTIRTACDFDQARMVYESIIAETPDEAEAFWGLVLCKYGIEYVDDPKTGKKVPTCHRTLTSSILNDPDYQKVLSLSLPPARDIYIAEAEQIDKIQKRILSIAADAPHYDVFICYKETDEYGKRTEDSYIAQEIYTELVKEGYKTFFSRSTLKDISGTDYEPYIYSALASAKVLLVVSTSYDYLEAVWVKNEWKRFLSMMNHHPEKTVIPCFRGLNPDYVDSGLSIFHALDLSDITFYKGMINSIKTALGDNKTVKVVEKEVISSSPSSASSAPTQPLIKRMFMFLEDRDFKSADEYAEKILDLDPECADAYLGKLLAEFRITAVKNLRFSSTPFRRSSNYSKVCRFAPKELVSTLEGYSKEIDDRIEENRKSKIYNEALDLMKKTESKEALTKASYSFDSISDYKDSKELAEKCRDLIFAVPYQKAKSFMNNPSISGYKHAIEILNTIPDYKDSKALIFECHEFINKIKEESKQRRYEEALALFNKNTEEGYRSARKLFNEIPQYKDSKNYAGRCSDNIDELTAKKNAQRRRANAYRSAKKGVGITLGVIAAILAVVFVISLFTTIIPSIHYKKAGELLESGDLMGAVNHYYKAKNYEDAKELYKENLKELAYENRSTIAAGKYHTVVVTEKGTVAAKGLNNYGQCDVKEWTDIVSVCAGSFHTIGLKSDGTLVATGNIYFSQLDYKNWTDIISIATYGDTIVGLKADGTVAVINAPAKKIGKWKNIVAIDAGDSHVVALKADGTAEGITSNPGYGQHKVDKWKDIVAISAGEEHTVGLKKDGTVITIGNNESKQCEVSEWSDIIAISAGVTHTVGLKADGTVVATGDNTDGKCDVEGWTDIVAVCAGETHTLGLKKDGTIVACGNNENGQCNITKWHGIMVPNATDAEKAEKEEKSE